MSNISKILNQRVVDVIELTSELNNAVISIEIERALGLLSQAIADSSPILIFGNGGSASDAQHITGELVGKFLRNRKPINAICLNSNTSILTAWANDFSYEGVFSRQVEAFRGQNAICWGISTSGNSKNIIKAVEKANSLGMPTITLCGAGGGVLNEISDVCIKVNSNNTPRIQEMHIIIYHLICEILEKGVVE